jgi:hypothetical protein
MIVLGLIAAFAIVAILIDPVEGNQTPHDPRTELPIWAILGRR